MNYKHTSYKGFINYCLGICKNKGYNYTKEDEEIIIYFEYIVNLLNKLIDNNIIELYDDIYESIINLFINDPNKAFNNIKYMLTKIKKVKNREVNFYYFMTSLSSMLNINGQFIKEYILNNNKESIFYPINVKVLIIKQDEKELYGMEDYDIDNYNNHGVYFIYDNNGELKYIGKSVNGVIDRSLESVKERELFNFSKIEYRYPNTKSDVGVYEAYYIAKYKPEKNNDMVFEDELSIELPNLDVGYSIKRNEDMVVSTTYNYYEIRTVDVDDFINSNNMYLLNNRNILALEENGVLSKREALNKANERCVNKAKTKKIKLIGF